MEVKLSLLVKLASLAVHTDELLSVGGHNFDKVAIISILADQEVSEFMADLKKQALLPVKRKP